MVIDETGNKLGVLNTQEAINLAQERELDLVEIVPDQRPPIARIMDFGKWMYEKERAARKKTKEVKLHDVKTIRIGLTTNKHDLEVKAKKIGEFLKRSGKVNIELRLKGRQIALKNIAREKIKNFLEYIKEPFQIEGDIKTQPRALNLIIKPEK